jgi:hypothetical protein
MVFSATPNEIVIQQQHREIDRAPESRRIIASHNAFANGAVRTAKVPELAMPVSRSSKDCHLKF